MYSLFSKVFVLSCRVKNLKFVLWIIFNIMVMSSVFCLQLSLKTCGIFKVEGYEIKFTDEIYNLAVLWIKSLR